MKSQKWKMEMEIEMEMGNWKLEIEIDQNGKFTFFSFFSLNLVQAGGLFVSFSVSVRYLIR